MFSRKVRYFFILVFTLTVLSSCTSLPAGSSNEAVSIERLLQGSPIVGTQNLPALPDPQLITLNQEMLNFLEKSVGRQKSQRLALRKLLMAIIKKGEFNLIYDDKTRTAAETFTDRAGNCLSFTNLFIAFARELGLKASYQEVDIPPYWGQQGDSYVFNLHVNVLLRLAGREQVVDFNLENFKSSYTRKVITDDQAKAHYYNNIAVEKMLEEQTLSSFQNFQQGLRFEINSAPLWTNLGTLYRRGNHFSYAESSYIQALKLDSNNYVAMTNLQLLYRRQGNTQLSEYYRQRVIHHRERNPYYRYQMGKTALANNDYNAAISHLRYAIRKKAHEDSFYFLLGRVFLEKGDIARGKNYFQLAVSVAEDDDLKETYRKKIKKILDTPLY